MVLRVTAVLSRADDRQDRGKEDLHPTHESDLDDAIARPGHFSLGQDLSPEQRKGEQTSRPDWTNGRQCPTVDL